jgi:CBS domain-containing protein
VVAVRALDLTVDYPTIDVSAPAIEAARMIGEEHRPAVVVLDQGRPYAVLPGSQVLNFLIPGYLQEDPSLVRAFDEKAADASAARLAGKSVLDLLRGQRRTELPQVRPEATVLECAAVMAKLHSPLLVVVDGSGVIAGIITASRLLETLVG